ncbi:hypothetical protein QF027_000251 [Streptomyces canus]|nr:hypothetical protein [Streptomyces canus]
MNFTVDSNSPVRGVTGGEGHRGERAIVDAHGETIAMEDVEHVEDVLGGAHEMAISAARGSGVAGSYSARCLPKNSVSLATAGVTYSSLSYRSICVAPSMTTSSLGSAACSIASRLK